MAIASPANFWGSRTDKWYCAAGDISTGSRKFYIGPTRLMTIHVNDPSANGYITVYDGVNSSGTRKASLGYLQHATASLRYRRGVKFATGLYIECSAATAVVTVEHEPLDIHGS